MLYFGDSSVTHRPVANNLLPTTREPRHVELGRVRALCFSRAREKTLTLTRALRGQRVRDNLSQLSAPREAASRRRGVYRHPHTFAVSGGRRERCHAALAVLAAASGIVTGRRGTVFLVATYCCYPSPRLLFAFWPLPAAKG